MDSDLVAIALNLQKKYTKFNEIYDLTKQIEDSLYRNDLYSLKLVIRMRTKAMLEAEEIDYKRQELLDAMPEDKKQIIMGLMNKDADSNDVDKKRICNIYRQIKLTINKTITLDKAVNEKMNRKGTIKL